MSALRQEASDATIRSKQALRLWLRLFSCSTLIEKHIRLRLKQDFKSTLPRFDVLSLLERHPDGCTMGELSNALMVSNGNVTGVVNRLIQDGLIIRESNPSDRRSSYVRISEKGLAEFDVMASNHEHWIEEMFQELSHEDIDHLLNLLSSLHQSIEQSKGGDHDI